MTPTHAQPSSRATYAVLIALWAAIFAVALTGYPKLLDNERRVGGYVLDAVKNGHWIIQKDATGDIASKPPVLTWIASLSTLCFGEINRFSIYLPSAIATLATTLLLFAAGRREFGARAGFLAAFIYLVSYVADAQVVTARYDGVFSFPVLLGAIAAFRAWTTGCGWTGFWAAVTLGTMVKGPLGLVLSASGLLAVFWQRRSGDRQPLKGSHWAGLALFLIVCGGWFALAYQEMGSALVAKLFGRELVGHVVHEGEISPGQRFWEPSWNTFRDFLPWSLAALVGAWRVLRRPAADLNERRFERFVFCWVAVSLVLFSVAAHQRGRLVWPLVPAIALLAGRELARWSQTMSFKRLAQASAAVAIVFLAAMTLYHHKLQARSRDVRTTLGMKALAQHLKNDVGAEFPLAYAYDAPFAVQFYLNTMRPHLGYADAAELLRSDAAAFVLARDPAKLAQMTGSNVTLTNISAWPSSAQPYVTLVGNRPALEWLPRMDTIFGLLRVRLENARIEKANYKDFTLTAQGTNASIAVTNRSATTAAPVRVRWKSERAFAEAVLQPGEGRVFLPQ